MSDTVFLTRIAAHPASGWISIGPCPGRSDQNRNLAADIASIRSSGVISVVTLCEQGELDELGVGAIGRAVVSSGLDWRHLPIPDFGAPSPTWDMLWQNSGPLLRGHLRAGHGVHLHCRGGCGRSGMIAARLMVELGAAPADAIERVRAARPCAIETDEQEAAVHRALRQAA
jgi:protein-tyrosine phosphatase